METGKLLLIGAVLAGGAYFLIKRASASSAAALPPSAVPSSPLGWPVPAQAVVVKLASTATPLAMPLTVAMWPADAGQPAGTFILIWNASDPSVFAALFYATQADGSAAKTPTVMAMGTDPGSTAIASSVATISSAINVQNGGPAATSGLRGLRGMRGLGGSVLPRYATISGMGEYFAA